jgi:hypothetical protein
MTRTRQRKTYVACLSNDGYPASLEPRKKAGPLSRAKNLSSIRAHSWVISGAYFTPTLEGQYIIKNLVLIGGALVLGATVRGGSLVAEPES